MPAGDTPRCVLCNGAAPFRFARERFAIHRCDACDLEFVHPIPDEATIAAVYARDYFDGTGLGYRDYFGAERRIADEKARTRVALLAASNPPAGSWLDLGCADGRFVLEAVHRGIDAHGVEHAESARTIAAREPLLAGRIHASLNEASPHAPFAVVTAWDVLEHLVSPIDTLRSLRPRLAPDALVGVVVPVIDNVNARRWPHTWDQYKPPEHLWFFSRRSLERVLEETLGATVIASRPAWRREARWSGVARNDARALQRIEGAAWRLAQRAGVVGAHALDDSWLVVARVP